MLLDAALALTGIVWGKCQTRWACIFPIYGRGALFRSQLHFCSFYMRLLARWSFVITPLNYNLAGANVFVAITNFYQLSRVARASTDKTEQNPVPAAIDK